MPEQAIISADNPWNYRCPMWHCSGVLWEMGTSKPTEHMYFCDVCGKTFLWCEVDA